MKRVLFLSACAVLLLSSIPFGQTLGNTKLLHYSTDSIRWTQCAFGPDGILWVVWVPGDTNSGSGGPVRVMSYDGTTFTGPAVVSGSTLVLANRPHISVSPKGHVLVSWGIAATKSVYLRIRDPQNGWGTIETVATGKGGDEPCAHMDASGNIHVLFSDETGGAVYACSKINGVWESVATLSLTFGKQGSLALGSDGTAHAVWLERETSSTTVFYNYYSYRTAAAAWATGEAVSGQSGSSNHPWVTVRQDNTPVITWQDVPYPDEPGKGSEIRVMVIGSTYELAIPLALLHYPRVAVDRNNVTHVACQAGLGDAGTGIRYTNNGSGVFQTVQSISGESPKLPGLAADLYGNVAATQSSYVTGSGGTGIWIYSVNPIQAIPPPVAAFTYSPVTGYPPLAVTFEAVHTYGPNGVEVNYDWVFGDGGTASGRSVTHVYRTAGTFNVRLTVIDSINRTAEKIKSVFIKQIKPLEPVNLSATITMSQFWQNPEITFNLFWAVNPANVPEHIEGYAIYMKENDGDYTRLLTVSPSTFSASFAFTDLMVDRYFAVSTLGKGYTESPLAYFQ